MIADTPIALANLTKMTPGEREALVINIRKRRMRPIQVYNELSEMEALARKEKLEDVWEKALKMFAKDLVRADKAMEKLEQRGVKLRALELEIEAM